MPVKPGHIRTAIRIAPEVRNSRPRCPLALAFIGLLLAGCGNSESPSRSSSVPTQRYTGTVRVGNHTVYLSTRTVGTTTETLYLHPDGPVSEANTRHIVTRKLPRVGSVLVDRKGQALYAFVPDRHGPSACTDQCARVWPPIRLTIEMVIDTSPVLEESLLTTEPDPERHSVGDRVVKFGGYVVHTYTREPMPGSAVGQGLNSYGGHWYLVSPSGKLKTTQR